MSFLRKIGNILSGKIAHLSEIAKPTKETWNRIKTISEEQPVLKELMTLGFVGAYGSLEYEILDSDPRQSEIGRHIKEIDERIFMDMFRLLFITYLYIYTTSKEFRHFVQKILPKETLWSKTSEILQVNPDEITKIVVRLKLLKEGHFSWAYDEMCKMLGVSPSAPALLQFEAGAIQGYCSLADNLRETYGRVR